MKIEELMIGNWVKIEGRPVRITDLNTFSDGSEIVCTAETPKHEKSWKLEDLSPLPITPENLALVGEWGSTNSFEFFLEYYISKNGGLVRTLNDVYLFAFGNWVLRAFAQDFNVESIHQIQNILKVVYGVTPAKP